MPFRYMGSPLRRWRPYEHPLSALHELRLIDVKSGVWYRGRVSQYKETDIHGPVLTSPTLLEMR